MTYCLDFCSKYLSMWFTRSNSWQCYCTNFSTWIVCGNAILQEREMKKLFSWKE